ncbi:MAG: helix-turn-helix domain-containing protein [Actinomycetales bacterium]|nr:helix-turn-helix domain-containing protein [Actinomycetales bacterium]
MTEAVRFSERLSALLEERGMTQMELADRIGVTRAAMSRYVKGEREPRFVTIARIAQELRIDVEELVASEDELIESTIRIVARHRLTDEQRARLQAALNGGIDS